MEIRRQYNIIYTEKFDMENQIEILSSKYLEADSLLEEKEKKLNELDEIRKSKESEVQKLVKLLKIDEKSRSNNKEIERMENKKRESFMSKMEELCSNFDTKRLKSDIEILSLLFKQFSALGAPISTIQNSGQILVGGSPLEICDKM